MNSIDARVFEIPEFKQRNEGGTTFLDLWKNAQTPQEQRQILREVKRIVVGEDTGRISRAWKKIKGAEEKVTLLDQKMDQTYTEKFDTEKMKVRSERLGRLFGAYTDFGDAEVLEEFSERIGDKSLEFMLLKLLQMDDFEEVRDTIQGSASRFLSVAVDFGLSRKLMIRIVAVWINEATKDELMEKRNFILKYAGKNTLANLEPAAARKLMEVSRNFQDPRVYSTLYQIKQTEEIAKQMRVSSPEEVNRKALLDIWEAFPAECRDTRVSSKDPVERAMQISEVLRDPEFKGNSWKLVLRSTKDCQPICLPEEMKAWALGEIYITGVGQPFYLPPYMEGVEKFRLDNVKIDEMPELPDVKELELIRTNLKEVPVQVDRMVNLRTLELADSQIEPASLRRLEGNRRLQKLVLRRCQIRSMPDSLELNRLKSLTIVDNPLEGFPPCIRRMQNLNFLECVNSDIETLPVWIRELDKLQEISLASNPIKKLPDEFGTGLQSLNLRSTKVEHLPQSLSYHEALRYVYVGHSRISPNDQVLKELTRSGKVLQ